VGRCGFPTAKKNWRSVSVRLSERKSRRPENTREEFAAGHANMESKQRIPNSHSLDGGCDMKLQLDSELSALTCPDTRKGVTHIKLDFRELF
jgi:hypothetical protein